MVCKLSGILVSEMSNFHPIFVSESIYGKRKMKTAVKAMPAMKD
jgi:hypothetical protein